jgi:serine/threonine-protein kinase
MQGEVDLRTDVYAAAVVLWELLAGRRLFAAGDALATMRMVLEANVAPPSRYSPHVPPALDELVLKGLSSSPQARFANACEMAEALESAVRPASAREVGEWVEATAGEAMQRRAELVAHVESSGWSRPVDEGAARGSEVPTRAEQPPPAAVLVAGAAVPQSPVARRESGRPSARAPSRKATVRGLFAGALAASVLVLAITGFALNTIRRAPAADRAPPSLPASATVAVAEQPSLAASNPPVANAPLPAVSPKSLAPAAVPAKKPPARTAAAAGTKVSCAAPFIWSADGKKIPKPECF